MTKPRESKQEKLNRFVNEVEIGVFCRDAPDGEGHLPGIEPYTYESIKRAMEAYGEEVRREAEIEGTKKALYKLRPALLKMHEICDEMFSVRQLIDPVEKEARGLDPTQVIEGERKE